MERKSISFTGRMLEMIDEIKSSKGYVSLSSVVQQAVVQMHSKTFPTYVIPRKDNSPEARLERKDEMKRLKEEKALEKQIGICEDLGGKVSEKADGFVCTYFTYTGKKRFRQDVPLAMVSNDLIKIQYHPSKEKVLKLQEEGKVDYEI